MFLPERRPLTPLLLDHLWGSDQAGWAVFFIPVLRAPLPPSTLHPPPLPEAPKHLLTLPVILAALASSAVLATTGKFQAWVVFLSHSRTRNEAEWILGSLGFTLQDVSVLDSC